MQQEQLDRSMAELGVSGTLIEDSNGVAQHNCAPVLATPSTITITIGTITLVVTATGGGEEEVQQ